MSAGGPTGVWGLVAAAFRTYRGYPLLFALLAAGVIVPYELIVLAATGAGPTTEGDASFAVAEPLWLVDWLLVGPFVSALHMHAVAEIRAGGEPELASIARRGLAALPVVAVAVAISTVGIVLGFAALFVPGVILLVRWYVVAQAAAIERDGWRAALRRSAQLTGGQFGHVLALAAAVAAITLGSPLLVRLAFGTDDTTVASFLAGLLVTVFAVSFGALTAALLYFDLRLRRRLEPAAAQPSGEQRPLQSSWDPRVYTDENRPAGWYVNPSLPHRMDYWGGPESPGWASTTRTPRKIRKAWDAALPES